MNAIFNLKTRAWMPVLLGVLLAALFLVATPGRVEAATCTTNGSGTDWGTATNWNCPDIITQRVPTNADDVVVANNMSISTSAVARTVSINSGITLTLADDGTNPGSLTVYNSSGMTINGTFTYTGNKQPNSTIRGAVTINSGASLISPSGGLTIRGNFVNNGTFDPGTFTLTFDGTTAISGSSTSRFHNVVINTLKTVTGPSSILEIKGNWTNNGAYTHNSGTVIFLQGASQSIYGSTTFNNLEINKTLSTDKVTLGANQTIANNLTISNGTFDLDIYSINRSSLGGTLSLSDGASILIGGDDTAATAFPNNYNVYTLGATSYVEYYGHDQTIKALTYGHLKLSDPIFGGPDFFGTKTLSSGTTTIKGNMEVAENVTVDASTNSSTVAFTLANGSQNLHADSAVPFYNLVVGDTTILVDDDTGTAAITYSNNITNTGIIRRHMYYSSGTLSNTFGLAGYLPNGGTLTVAATDDTGRGTLTELVVDRTDEDAPNHRHSPDIGVGRYWIFTPTGDVTSVSVTLPHAVSPSTNAYACNYSGEGATPTSKWNCGNDPVTSNTATFAGVTSLKNLSSTYSEWGIGDAGPTALNIEFFRPVRSGSVVELVWETTNEAGILGFNLYRRLPGEKNFEKVNDALIAAQNPGSPQGAAYIFSDDDANADLSYEYLLEMIGPNLLAAGSDQALYLPRAFFLPLVIH